MDEIKLKKGYTGYLLTEQARSELLGHIEPMFDNVIAHHVTHEHGVYETKPPFAGIMPDINYVRVIAVASNERVQAAVVKVGDTTQRPDGRTYHITVSIAGGAAAKESNDMLDDLTNRQNVDPFNLAVIPKFFNF